MLLQLLQLIVESQGSATMQELAERLGASTGLVEQMIEQLVRLGCLKAVEPGCGESACHGCPQAGACGTQIHARLWVATDKGRRLLSQGSA